MTVFEYSLPAVRGLQAGREYFVTMCPLAIVPRLLDFEEERLRPELRAQRVVTPGRIPELTRYIASHPKTYVLSSLVCSIDGQIQFEPLPGLAPPTNLGLLKVPMSARLLIHDGLHRRAAIEEALKLKPELGEETISLVLFVDPGLRRAEQVFSDLKRNETRSARSQGILYDRRDEMARLTRALVRTVPVFAELTEMVRSKISNRSLKLFTLSGIYHATSSLLAGRQEESFSAKLTLAGGFWLEVAKQIPDWERARAREISPAELRKTRVHAHAIALAALARVGQTLLESPATSWKKNLRDLGSLDWSRDNTRLWEGRAMIAGRLSKATTCVLLTGNAVKQHLGLPLTPEEEQAERQFKARG
jgi:DNA sulfur modification protein DndB